MWTCPQQTKALFSYFEGFSLPVSAGTKRIITLMGPRGSRSLWEPLGVALCGALREDPSRWGGRRPPQAPPMGSDSPCPGPPTLAGRTALPTAPCPFLTLSVQWSFSWQTSSATQVPRVRAGHGEKGKEFLSHSHTKTPGTGN